MLPKSYFNMWRALVCMVHADHVVRDEEREFILEEIASMPFLPEEKRLLEEELITPNDIDKILPLIHHKDDQQELLRLALLLFWRDGEFAPEEQAMLEKIKANLMSDEDFNEMSAAALDEIPADTQGQKRMAGVLSRLKTFLTQPHE